MRQRYAGVLETCSRSPPEGAAARADWDGAREKKAIYQSNALHALPHLVKLIQTCTDLCPKIILKIGAVLLAMPDARVLRARFWSSQS